MTRDPPDERLALRDIALLLIAIAPLFIRLGATPATGSEGRWLQIAQHMHESGDWSRPVLGTRVYWDKPLLSYWAIAALGLPFDHIDEGLARLPGALASGLTVLLTAWLAARLFGRRSAVLSGWVLATSFSFYIWSRTAAADSCNLLFTTASIAVYVASLSRSRAWHIPLFFALLAVGGHVKGMTAVLVPIAVVVADHVVARRMDWPRRWAIVLPSVIGAIALYLLPLFLLGDPSNGLTFLKSVWRENFLRAFDSFDHNDENLTYYLYVFPAMFLPWSLFLVQGISMAATRFRSHRGSRFALTAFAVILAIFSVSQSRRSYYILPLFPVAAMLVGSFLAEVKTLREARSTAERRWGWSGVVPLAVLTTLIAVGAAYLIGGRLLPGQAGEIPRLLPHAAALGAALALGVTVIGVAWLRWRSGARYFAVLAVLILGWSYVSLETGPLRAGTLAEKPFAVALRSRYPANEVIYYGFSDSKLTYYIGAGEIFRDLPSLVAALRRAGPETIVVCEPARLGELESCADLRTRRLLVGKTQPFGTIMAERTDYYALSCTPRDGETADGPISGAGGPATVRVGVDAPPQASASGKRVQAARGVR